MILGLGRGWGIRPASLGVDSFAGAGRVRRGRGSRHRLLSLRERKKKCSEDTILHLLLLAMKVRCYDAYVLH